MRTLVLIFLVGCSEGVDSAQQCMGTAWFESQQCEQVCRQQDARTAHHSKGCLAVCDEGLELDQDACML